MWTELTTWRQVFYQFDKDKSGYIEASELRKVLSSIGKTASLLLITSLNCLAYYEGLVLTMYCISLCVTLYRLSLRRRRRAAAGREVDHDVRGGVLPLLRQDEERDDGNEVAGCLEPGRLQQTPHEAPSETVSCVASQ